MPAKSRILLTLFVVNLLLGSVPVQGIAAEPSEVANVEAVHCPPLTLKDWVASSSQEQYAFLFGFVTMLEMEKEWQGEKPLPLSRSLVHSWVNGLAGVTLREMHKTIEDYIVAHPEDQTRNVVEVLGHAYVRPKLTPAMREEARAHLDAIAKQK